MQANGVKDAQGAEAFVAKLEYKYKTKLGTVLDAKILQPFVLRPAQNGNLHKPVLVIVITDGAPEGEPKDKLEDVIKYANKVLERTKCEFMCQEKLGVALTSPQTRAMPLRTSSHRSGTTSRVSIKSLLIQHLFTDLFSAQDFLSALDSNSKIGNLVDQTMSYEYEQDEMMKKTKQNLTPEMWLRKLILGAIDPSLDSRDEGDKPKAKGLFGKLFK